MSELLNPALTKQIQQLEEFPLFYRMGIKVLTLQSDWSLVRLLLPFSRVNQNPGGSVFGGAMAALADPIAALACAQRFPTYAVWTKNLHLDFIKPGLCDLQLWFEFPEQAEQEIKQALAQQGQADYRFSYGIYLAEGELVARVACVVAIRPRDTRKAVVSCVDPHDA